MSALARERNTKRLAIDGLLIPVMCPPMNGGSKVYQGGLGCLNSEGNAVPGATATGLECLGRVERTTDNTAGADAAISTEIQPGCFLWANSASTDTITKAEVGKVCYIVDDQTVAKTDGTASRSPAGIVYRVDTAGVWVISGVPTAALGGLATRIAVLEA